MRKKVLRIVALATFFFTASISKAQTTAMQFKGLDCNGVSRDLFADLDAGKAVLLHFFMPSCGSCPPPAQKIQKMANGILAKHPGMITAYAIPFNNSTTCTYTSTWVSSNGLSLYSPVDSGADQVAYYGGFGMPTVVVLGGKNHKVLFNTQSFTTSDTSLMKKAILDMLNGVNRTKVIGGTVNSVNVYPNPASEKMQVVIELTNPANIKIEVMNLMGEVVNCIYEGKPTEGVLRKEINTSDFNNGIYFLRVTSDHDSKSYKFSVAHS